MHQKIGKIVKKYRFLLGAVVILLYVTVFYLILHNKNIAVLNPAGPIAEKERNLIYFALGLASVVVIPVFSLLFIFAYKYRETNKKAKYSPNLAGNRIVEGIWWLIPGILISILAVVTWNSSYALNPYNPIVSKNKQLTIEVVALDWKWLFIYPQQNIASVNFFQFPLNTPVNFQITSDTVMNSFWVPQLSGQIYAMPGMNTQLNILAYRTGSFNGSSANISGSGFAGMTFVAKSSTVDSFNNWVASVRKASTPLSLEAYDELSKPSSYNPVTYYSSTDQGLYADIMDKYMGPIVLTAGGQPANNTNTVSNSDQTDMNMEMR